MTETTQQSAPGETGPDLNDPQPDVNDAPVQTGQANGKPFVRLDTAPEICKAIHDEIELDLLDILKGAQAMTRMIDETIDRSEAMEKARTDRRWIDCAIGEIGQVYANTLGSSIDFSCLSGEPYANTEQPQGAKDYNDAVRLMIDVVTWRLDRIRMAAGVPSCARHMAEGDYWHGEVKGGAE